MKENGPSVEKFNPNLYAHIFSSITRAAAIAAHSESGRGEKEKADQAAVTVMRNMLNILNISGTIVVGEGVKDEAPMLFINEKVGKGGVAIDIAVDPIEGTDATAGLLPNAYTTLVATEGGGILRLPEELIYVDKLITGPQARDFVNINASVKTNLAAIAKALDKDVSDLQITVLDRPRNQALIQQIRDAGAKVALIKYGDLMPGIASCMSGLGVHAVMGIGGAPEAILAAAAVKCFKGGVQIKPWTDNTETETIITNFGFPLDRVLNQDELVPGNNIVFSATPITGGVFGKGIRTFPEGIRTEGILITLNNGVLDVQLNDHATITNPQKCIFKL